MLRFWKAAPMLEPLYAMIDQNRAGTAASLVSVCSAHPDVLRASLNWAERRDLSIIVETTSNQVNQDGGYTGLTPRQFADDLRARADEQGVSWDRIILGGDHLGPQAWKALDADTAMTKSKTMVEGYVQAGFKKIHLDCSQACAGDVEPLSDAIVAERSAVLAAACEAASTGEEPVYIIGTEVPIPGGATEDAPEDQDETLAPTKPEAAAETLQAHADAFEAHGLTGLLNRVVGLVVQPGVEFLPMSLHALPEDRDPKLREVALSWPRLVLEAHSTDYQKPAVFRRLAELGFGFQKVGPALTFAARQALYALDQALAYQGRSVGLFDVMEEVMLADPSHWKSHHAADDKIARHFGLSDRIRYYWNTPAAQSSVAEVRNRVRAESLPDPLLRQVFGMDVLDRAAHLDGTLDQRLIDASIELALDPYDLTRVERIS